MCVFVPIKFREREIRKIKREIGIEREREKNRTTIYNRFRSFTVFRRFIDASDSRDTRKFQPTEMKEKEDKAKRRWREGEREKRENEGYSR